MKRRRGLIFWTLGLHSARCRSCRRDLIWRRKCPTRCRWCGVPVIDWAAVLGAAKAASRAMADFARQLEEFNRVASGRNDDMLDALVLGVLRLPGGSRPLNTC